MRVKKKMKLLNVDLTHRLVKCNRRLGQLRNLTSM